MKKLFIIIVLLSTGCATNTYSTWTESEQNKYKYYLSMQLIDTAQTYKVIKCTPECGLMEANPLYGSKPSVGKLLLVKAATNALVYNVLGRDLSEKDRGRALNIMNTGTTLVVLHNQILISKSF